jgi:hypothetical protein
LRYHLALVTAVTRYFIDQKTRIIASDLRLLALNWLLHFLHLLRHKVPVDRENAGNHVREDIFPLVFSDWAWSTFPIIVVFEVENHDRDRSCP